MEVIGVTRKCSEIWAYVEALDLAFTYWRFQRWNLGLLGNLQGCMNPKHSVPFGERIVERLLSKSYIVRYACHFSPSMLVITWFRIFKTLNGTEQQQDRSILLGNILSCEILFFPYCSPTLLTCRSIILEIEDSCIVDEAKQFHSGERRTIEKN